MLVPTRSPIALALLLTTAVACGPGLGGNDETTAQSVTAASTYVGCYTDSSTRALPEALMASGATVESCVAAAEAKGLSYAGLQYGGQCFGGDALGITKVSDSECNMGCKADPSEICGGTWRNSVYSVAAGECVAPTGAAVSVNAGVHHQTIDGFGASNASGGDTPNPALTTAQAAFFYGTGAGQLGFSLYRAQVPATTDCSTVNSGCAAFALSDMQAVLAAGSGVRVWGTPWSPPAAMKTNGNTACRSGAGNGALASGSYAAYARFLANYVKSLSTYHGITLDALSVQNEPQVCQQYESALWTASDIHTFVKDNLGPTFAAEALTTSIMIPEAAAGNDAAYAGACMTDPACAKYVGINAFHDYDDSFTITNPYAARFWETEVSAGVGYGPNAPGCSNGEWCPGIADAMMWAKIIDYDVGVADVNAWHYWQLIDLYGDNEGLTKGGVTAIRAYVIGNWSRYVRPGWVRVDATHAPAAGVTVTAFVDTASQKVAIVAVNQNAAATDVALTLKGVSSVSSVTPTITSATARLADQSPVSLCDGAFSYALPPTSVVTFHSP